MTEGHYREMIAPFPLSFILTNKTWFFSNFPHEVIAFKGFYMSWADMLIIIAVIHLNLQHLTNIQRETFKAVEKGTHKYKCTLCSVVRAMRALWRVVPRTKPGCRAGCSHILSGSAKCWGTVFSSTCRPPEWGVYFEPLENDKGLAT